MPHTSVSEHAAHIRSLVSFGGVETVPLNEALGRCLVTDATTPVDLPLFRNSQMDGFAVRAADVQAGVTLPVVGVVAARPGTPARLDAGTSVRIMTGAVVPDGADLVVRLEDTSSVGDTVTFTRSYNAGTYVRERGSDATAGTVIVAGNTVIASRHIGALAAAGISEIEVKKKPRVAVITTGAELVDASATPQLGQLFDSNLAAMSAAIVAAGGVVVGAHRVTDDVDELLAVLAGIEADVIVTSGGISMGDYEVVRLALEPLGASVGHIAMQPGGPQATAVFDGTPVLCFPGNPVSTQISFEVFLAPLLREAAGIPQHEKQWRRLAQLVDSIPGKRQFLRGRRVDGGRVEVVAGPGSHLVAGLAASDVLIDIPEDVTELQEGDAVECWVL